ncbi:MAG: hypothetical protein WC761_01850 [Candidatus Paceibacterota bacterium]|jgi:hypothetical protein
MNSEIRKALNTERRKRFLENLITEAVINVLAEQQAPPLTPPPAAPVGAPPPATPLTDPTAPPAEQAPVNGAFTVDDMIERLNVVRGGRSFTDPEVYGQLVSYFKTLDDPQREALKTFLVELGKIVIDVKQEEPGSVQQPQQTNVAPPAPPAAPAAGGIASPAAPAI